MKLDHPHMRSFCRILGLILLAALAAAAMASIPLCAAVQPSVLPANLTLAAAVPNTATANSAAGQSDQSPDSAQKIYAYLHSPAVQWAGKQLHLSTNAASVIFVVINFIILFLFIAAPLAKILPKVMRKRSETLRHNIKTAREISEQAKARLSAVEAKLAGLDEEIQKIRTQMEQEMLADQAHMKAALEEEKDRIVAAAEQELNAAAVQAKRGLRTLAANLAIERASKQLLLTPETDRALIAEFIGHAGGDHGEGNTALRGGKQ